MKRRFQTYYDIAAHCFDAIIDVRSPAEFAEDHVPGAINLPVLDNAERARVGTIYKQDSPFRARKIGAALVFRNAALHIENRLAGHDGGWRPLVYCWRGGQRSGAFTWMLREIGWRAEVIEGGYKTYRRLVSQRLYEGRLAHRFVQIGGHTGTAKTALLPRLAARGVQVLDLEGLARHRGSLLGGLSVGQPSQKGFESALAAALARFDPERPVVVEAESSKIGSVNLPPAVWAAMRRAPWLMVEAPIEARARYLAHAYEDVLADGVALKDRLAPLRHFRGSAVIEKWSSLIDAGDPVALCHALAEDHYDPAYAKSLQAVAPEIAVRFSLSGLGADDLDRAADDVAAWLQAKAT
ncbi:tRNA 2-selenouridine(34) synthase MnmH [Citreimonas salinaria]|uniref:tRNA 2-selenouridine synthase n=1 Tax=Citreimonas salinaria TaxID=321339 RepID=A0A1H3JHQ3_9RHOB|nr:tRNA 2-selenouridine(34) synthase MnmH [Citreimonas salinaria]SDY38764.1 tRNA 2-selenouridine synthase [Citreimonas salinaria]